MGKEDAPLKKPCLFVPRHGQIDRDQWYLIEGKILVGKALDAAICLDSFDVADRHCTLFERDSQVFLTDLGPSKGTYVNGLRLTAHTTVMLEDADLLLVGGLTLRFFYKPILEIQQLKLLSLPKDKSFSFSPSPPPPPSFDDKELPPPIPDHLITSDSPDDLLSSVLTEEKDLDEAQVDVQESEVTTQVSLHETSDMEMFEEKTQIIPPSSLLFFVTAPAPHLVAPLYRLLSFVLDLGLTFFMWCSVKGHPFFRALDSIIRVFLLELLPPPLYGKLLFFSWTIPLIVFFFFWPLFQMVCHLILGISLSGAILGLKGGESFVWDRIGGAIRVFIQWITFPLFFLTELPLFFGKRSFKEVLSMTHIVKAPFYLHLVADAILLPLFLVFIVAWPFLFYPTLRHPLSFSQKEDSVFQNEKSIPVASSSVSSRYFRLSFSYAGEGPLVLMPSFDVVKKGSFKRIIPLLSIYDTKNSVSSEWSAEEISKLGRLIYDVVPSIWRFSSFYPSLWSYFSTISQEDIERSDFLFPPLNLEAQNELKLLLVKSLTLRFSLREIWSNIMRGDFFIYGHALLRSKILHELLDWHFENSLDIKMLQWGNSPFLTFSQKDKGHFFLPMGSFNGPLYKFSVDAGGRFSQTEHLFLLLLNRDLLWDFDHPQNGTLPMPTSQSLEDIQKSLSQFHLFHIVDFYGQQEITGDGRLLLEKFLYSFYSSLAKRAIESKDTRFIELVSYQLERLCMVSSVLSSTIGDRGEFIDTLRELQKVLSDRNMSFFQVSSLVAPEQDVTQQEKKNE